MSTNISWRRVGRWVLVALLILVFLATVIYATKVYLIASGNGGEGTTNEGRVGSLSMIQR